MEYGVDCGRNGIYKKNHKNLKKHLTKKSDGGILNVVETFPVTLSETFPEKWIYYMIYFHRRKK